MPEDSVLKYENFPNGHEAFMSSKSVLDGAVQDLIKNNEESNVHSNVYALVLSKSPSGKSIVQGFIEAEINNGSINYS